MNISKSAKRRLHQCFNFLLENDWKVVGVNEAQGHMVLKKERLIKGTFNTIGLRTLDNFLYLAIAINEKHAYQGNVKDFKQFQATISEWGVK
jgi:hypothetical protein